MVKLEYFPLGGVGANLVILLPPPHSFNIVFVFCSYLPRNYRWKLANAARKTYFLIFMRITCIVHILNKSIPTISK